MENTTQIGKTCTCCNRQLPLSHFWKNGRRGRRSQCKECLGPANRKRALEQYRKDPESKIEYQRDYYNKNRESILSALKTKYEVAEEFREKKKENSLRNYWADPVTSRVKRKESMRKHGHKWRANQRVKYEEDPSYRENVLTANREWRKENIEKDREIKREYYQNNKDRFRVYQRNRKKHIGRATPPWVNSLADFLDIEKECLRISEELGIKHHIDHIIPLRGTLTGFARGKKTVCGLHVPENLQIITEAENLSKGCRFDPKQWDESLARKREK